jgi:hypothetical protein
MPAGRQNAKLVSLAITASSALHAHFAVPAWRRNLRASPRDGPASVALSSLARTAAIVLITNSEQAGGMVPRDGKTGAGSDKAWPL